MARAGRALLGRAAVGPADCPHPERGLARADESARPRPPRRAHGLDGSGQSGGVHLQDTGRSSPLPDQGKDPCNGHACKCHGPLHRHGGIDRPVLQHVRRDRRRAPPGPLLPASPGDRGPWRDRGEEPGRRRDGSVRDRLGAFAGAVAMQQGVELDNRLAPNPIGLRVGIGSGDATREGDDYFGDPVVTAARLCARAEGGQILVTDVSRAIAGRRSKHRFEPLGALELKGLGDPVEALELQWDPIEMDRAWRCRHRAAARPPRVPAIRRSHRTYRTTRPSQRCG